MKITGIFVWGLLPLVLGLGGCGKKAELKYPEYFAPAKVENLRAKRDGNDVVLNWTSPKQTAAGNVLKDLALFYIKRAPFALRPHEYDFDTIAEVAVDTDRESREGPLSYEYRDLAIGKSSDFQYMIVPANSDGVEGEKLVATVQSLPAPKTIPIPATTAPGATDSTATKPSKAMEQHND